MRYSFGVLKIRWWILLPQGEDDSSVQSWIRELECSKKLEMRIWSCSSRGVGRSGDRK